MSQVDRDFTHAVIRHLEEDTHTDTHVRYMDVWWRVIYQKNNWIYAVNPEDGNHELYLNVDEVPHVEFKKVYE